MKNIIQRILKKIKSVKKPVLAGITIALVLLILLIFRMIGSKNKKASVTDSTSTITLAKTDIQNTLSISGQIDSADTINIYTSLNSYPVKEIFVKVGDKVRDGELLAQIDTTNLEYEIKQAKNNLENAIEAFNTEKQNYQNSIVNAENSLDSAIISRDKQQLSYEKILAEYKKAEETMLKSFDSYTYDNTINEAYITLKRKLEELKKAENEHLEARENFDDYTYQNTIVDARAKLNRALDDLRDAREDLRTQKSDFDDYTYENAIREAKAKLDNENEKLKKLKNQKNNQNSEFDSSSYDNAISSAQSDLDRYQQEYNNAVVNDEDMATAKANLDSAKATLDRAKVALASAKSEYESLVENIDNQIKAAEQAVAEAERSYNRAIDNLEQARDNAINTAEKNLVSARNSADDAQRAYDRAITDLERAQDSSIESAEDKIKSAQKAVDDAQRTYDKAISDLKRAQNDYIEDNEEKLTTTKRNLADAEKSLESSNLNVANAENSLKQAKSKTTPSNSSVSNQQITLDKLIEQMEKSRIKATGTGTITSIGAIEGTNPTGVLFVIEDTNMLYVAAKVKEYNLKNLSLGQKSLVTTDATGTEIFDGEIIYISPKAVTEAGSTNVEFEIWIKICDPDENIKIGMNAFMEIILEEKQDTFVVPLSAIISNEEGNFIQYQSHEEISLLPVEIGIKTTTSAEIFGEGLVDGMIIISGSYPPSQNERMGPIGGPPFGN